MQKTLIKNNETQRLVSSPASIVDRFFREQDKNFVSILTQMAQGQMLQLPNQRPIDLQKDSLVATLALNQFITQQETANTQLLKILSFEQKLADQLNSLTAT